MNRERTSGSKRLFVELVCRYIVGLTFVYASIHKIADPAAFAKIIYGYGVFPAVSINLIAIVMPFVELVCGLSLIIGVWPRSGSLLAILMLTSFVILITYNLVRGHEFDCGCFSIGKEGFTSDPVNLLVRNVILICMSLYVTTFRGPRKLSILSSGSIPG